MHLNSLIHAFVIHLFESNISRLYESEISIFLLVSEAEQAGLIFTFYGILEHRFSCTKVQIQQAFRFMVGPGHCPMISKYGPSLSKAVGSVDPSFSVVKKFQFNKNIHLTASL